MPAPPFIVLSLTLVALCAAPAAARDSLGSLDSRVTQLELQEQGRAVQDGARLPPLKTPAEKAEEEAARLRLCGVLPKACE